MRPPQETQVRPVKQARNADGLLLTPGMQALLPPHPLAQALTQKTLLDVALVGCGGTGSQVLTGLGQIHASLRAMNAQEGTHLKGLCLKGLHVTVYDPDTVSPFNVGRQLFYDVDVGQKKATCLVGRVNTAYSTRWEAVPEKFDLRHRPRLPDILITCTDTAKSRREMHQVLWDLAYSHWCQYWLDCGNLASVGQVVLGQPGRAGEDQWPRSREFDPEYALWSGQAKKQIKESQMKKSQMKGSRGHYPGYAVEDKCFLRLPCVTELFPDLMDEGFVETDAPSCSMVEALGKQSLFVNRRAAADALDLLGQLLFDGQVGHQGTYFNLKTGRSAPVPLKVWPVQAKRVQARRAGPKHILTPHASNSSSKVK